MQWLFNILYILPKSWISFLTGKLVSVRFPWPISLWLTSWFASRYNINLQEAEKPISEYKSIQNLFTRKLKPGLRPIGEGPIVHPVDSMLTQVQKVEAETLIQAKGHRFNLNSFLANDKAFELFKNGHALTYYLCPTDYHRVHSPVDGEIVKVHYLPGKLWPVNNWSVQNIKELFSVNERVVIWIKTDVGMVAYVMVGATNVGKMTLSFDPDIVTNQSMFKSFPLKKSYDPRIQIKKGDELGIFNMGSTVIVLYENGLINKEINYPQQTQFGASL